jgi:hypothetical protein
MEVISYTQLEAKEGFGFYPVLTDTTKEVHTAPRRSVHDYT